MGRHEHPDGGAFYRSLGVSALRAAIILVVVSLGTAAVVILSADLTAGSPVMDVPPDAAVTEREAAASGDDVVQPATPPPTPEPSPEPTSDPVDAAQATEETDAPEEAEAEEADAPEPEAEPSIKPPAATAIQVLDGGAGPGATQEAVALLRDLGYDIVAVSGARCCYEETTVLFTSGNEHLGHALAERDARFTAVRANPNLSESVDLHVVIGRDWVS